MSIVDKFIKNYTDSNKERIKKIVDEIDALAPKYRKYKDSDITSESLKLKSRLQNGESKESIMVDAFALCREAILRRQKMFAYKVQLEAAVSMQDNVVAEMKTGYTLLNLSPQELNSGSRKEADVTGQTLF